MIRIAHNPRCGKSRVACSLIQELKSDCLILDYLHGDLTIELLQEIENKSNQKIESFIRKKENVFIDNFKGKKKSSEQWFKILIDFPILLERPIVITDKQAFVVRTEEELNQLKKLLQNQ